MTRERWQQIDTIFREAVQLEGEKRLSFLEKACQGDSDLRLEVESLLASDRKSSSPLDGSAFAALNTEQLDSAMQEWQQDGTPGPQPEPQPEPQPVRPRPMPLPDDGRTRGALGAEFDPVVGWLVCVKGSDRGRDYRILSQRNRIGRDTQMEICISGDRRISRDTHAIITYEPRNKQFWLSPGMARGVAYLNGQLVDAATPLQAYDTIELGETGLQFIPFCGERFQWK
ncbi:MAG TPA: FHA domain-containing protein [Verrucomicrobiae bacterium]|nr:FHA domain-containing protein [Verrucomicrobiae bacterium]